jgi:hypothetical protein
MVNSRGIESKAVKRNKLSSGSSSAIIMRFGSRGILLIFKRIKKVNTALGYLGLSIYQGGEESGGGLTLNLLYEVRQTGQLTCYTFLLKCYIIHR